MGSWILIVALHAATTQNNDSKSARDFRHSYHVAMQEFGDLQSCQHASVEAQKVAPGIRVVCVPKGGK